MIYEISYKTLIDPKPLRIRFEKINEIRRIYDGTTTYLTLFGSEKYYDIYNKIGYLISLKSSILTISRNAKMILNLKVIASGTYRGPSEDSQGTNRKTDDLMKKNVFDKL